MAASSGLGLFSAWREPLAPDWRERAAALLATVKQGPETYDQIAVAAALRRLAGAQLDQSERIKVRRIARQVQADGGLSPFRSLRVLIVSNRTSSFLAADLEAVAPTRNLLIEAVETDYDAVASIAFDDNYAAPEGPLDAVVIMVDHDYFAASTGLLDPDMERDRHADALTRLEGTCHSIRTRFGLPVIVSTLPLGLEFAPTSAERAVVGSTARLVAALNRRIHDGGQAGEWLVWDLEALAGQVGGATWFDPVRFHEAKVPFAIEVCPIAADSLSALLAALVGKSGRALVLDLDNTLWGGVVADDGLDGISLGSGTAEGEAFVAFQRYVLDMRARGVVLAVCSKNVEAIAREPFQRHPEMLLSQDHIAVFIADFADKATNVAAVAKSLDLDPSSLVFVDDNPAERERVRSELPFALVPEIGEDPAGFPRLLAASGFLEHLALTADDTNRAAAYAARSSAKALRDTIGNYDDYLRSLDMEMAISAFAAIDRSRVTQLIQKSNQFNLTTRRYSQEDVAALEVSAGRLGWSCRLKDRFADHGLISVVIVDKGPLEWLIDSWVMSCRVLERGVERGLMNELVRQARREGAKRLVGVYLPTPRNGLVKGFFDRFGFTVTEQTAEETRYALDLDQYTVQDVQMRVRTPSQVS